MSAKPPAKPATPATRTMGLMGRLPITTKLLMVLLLVSLLPMGLIAHYNLKGSTESISQAEQDNMQLLAASLAGRLDQLIGGMRNTINFLTTEPLVISYLDGEKGLAELYESQVYSLLSRIVSVSEDITTVYLMNAEGVFVASTNSKVIAKKYDYREYYREAIQGKNYISDLLVGSTSKETGVYFSQPVKNDKGAIIGVAVIKLNGEAVSRILEKVNNSTSHTSTFLVNPEGIVIEHPNSDLMYRSLGYLSRQEIDNIQEHKRFPVKDIQSLNQHKLATAMIRADKPGYLRYFPNSNDPSVLGYAPMQTHFWVVAVEKPEKIFAAPLNELYKKVLMSLILIGSGIVVVALVLSRAMVRPIRMLTEATRFLSDTSSAENQDTGATTSGEKPEADSAGKENNLQGQEFKLSQRYKKILEDISSARKDEIGILAHSFNEMEEHLQEYIEDLKDVTAAKERIESEMKIGAQIQMSFLPEPLDETASDPAVKLFAVIDPAKEVGGDLYDYFFLDKDHLFCAVGDVSDKGIPAGLFMGVTLALMRHIASKDKQPSEIMQLLNIALCQNNTAFQFVTLFIGILNIRTGEFRFSHGGHNPPYIFSPLSGQNKRLVPSSGGILGLDEDIEFATESIVLEAGERIFLYSDGVTEAMNEDKEQYEEERLCQCLGQIRHEHTPQEVVDLTVADVKRFSGDAPQSDDITAMCVAFTPVE